MIFFTKFIKSQTGTNNKIDVFNTQDSRSTVRTMHLHALRVTRGLSRYHIIIILSHCVGGTKAFIRVYTTYYVCRTYKWGITSIPTYCPVIFSNSQSHKYNKIQ